MICRYVVAVLILLAVIVLPSCGCGAGKKDRIRPDTPVRGEITISADESFRPIVQELVKVYEGNNIRTKINVQYKPEADCIKDLWNDSIRMVISTLKLTDTERMALVDSIHSRVWQQAVARDAIAVIVNPASPDSVFDMNEIRKILTGQFRRPKTPVFDGVKATSTVRFVVDSVLRGAPLTDKAMAARTSDSVIDFVANTLHAVGFIGVSWVGNKEDRQQLSFLKKVKIARIESNDVPGNYILPVQANIYGKLYPMTRDLTYIVKEKYRGLGTGFAEFISGHLGQLIFKRAYLMPGRENFFFRPIQLKED